MVPGRGPVNPYLGRSTARATNVAGGGQVSRLTPLSQTNAAINSIYNEPVANDVVMDEAEEPAVAPPVVLPAATLSVVAGGRAIVLTKIAWVVRLYVA